MREAVAHSNWRQKRRGNDAHMPFSLIYFFAPISIFYIPHNYVIPQAMPHAIPQTHSSFYPHRSSNMIDICMALDQSVSPHTGVRTIQNTGVSWRAVFQPPRPYSLSLKHGSAAKTLIGTFSNSYSRRRRRLRPIIKTGVESAFFPPK